MNRPSTVPPEPFLGLLTPALIMLEDYNVWGYVTATRVKILAIVRDGASKNRKDEENILRSLFRSLHALYVDAASNPFLESFETPSFASGISRAAEQHTRLLEQAPTK